MSFDAAHEKRHKPADAAAATKPKKQRRADCPSTDEEAQALLDAKAPSKALQKQFNAYRLCGGCQARDTLHADANRIVTMLSSLASSTETCISAPDFFASAGDDCYHIIHQLNNPLIHYGRMSALSEIDAINHLFTLVTHTEMRREREIEAPLLTGHFGAGAARLIAEAMPLQAMDVVHLVVSYIDIGEIVNPPAANRMFRVYTEHVCRFLRAQQARLEFLDTSTQVPRHLVDVDRIAALHSIHAVVMHANLIRTDPRYAAYMPEHESDLTVDMHMLSNSRACRHTSKEASELRNSMAQYASDLRAERARLRGLGFQVTAKLAELESVFSK
jgi:hypothetical protein